MARTGDMIVLAGEMGAGKTAFAQGFGAALGVAEPMTSPTFTLVHSYDLGRITLHHADIYRLTTRNELDDLALSELLEFDGIVLLEWGDVVAQSLGEHLLVRLQAAPGDDEDARFLAIIGTGKRWAARWERLRSALEKFQAEPEL